MGPSLIYKSEKILKMNPRCLQLGYTITAAKTVTPTVMNSVSLTTFDAFASQAVIDAFLGTTNEFLLAAFDATAMGTDAFGGVVDMQGQVATAAWLETDVYTAADASGTNDGVPAVAALTASSLTTQYAKGANGNLAFRVIHTGLDALTTGLVIVKLYWISA